MWLFYSGVIIMAVSGLMLFLALGLFLLVLWLNPRRQVNLYYGLLLFMLFFWTAGSLLAGSIAYIGGDEGLVNIGVRLLQAGFVASSIMAYLFTAVLVGSRGRYFAVVSATGLFLLVVYQGILLLNPASVSYSIVEGRLLYDFQPAAGIIFLLFGGLASLLLWLQRRKTRGQAVRIGLWLFLLAQVIALLNPYLRSLSVPVLLAGLAVFLISLSMVRQQVASPLFGRASQLETVRDIGLVITSRLQLDVVLASIAAQATALLNADAAAIYLLRESCLEVAAVFNMPAQFVGYRLPLDEGFAGKAAIEGHAINLDDYAQQWQGQPDLPLARSTFGSVVAAPLVFGERPRGILLVVLGRQGRIFSQEDMRLLELLGPQAAIAIANSELFERQSALTEALTSAKSQLETVLTSTHSPVVAVNRRLEVIFANPAAVVLASAISQVETESVAARIQEGAPVTSLVPVSVLPADLYECFRSLRDRQVFIYELTLADRDFMCHVAPLGKPRPVGWVAVLNDVTELKELDRFKSQMVRMTSHDLKNPLFAAMSYLDLLQDEFSAGSLEHLVKVGSAYVDTIFHQLERMNRTISSILDLERVEAGVHVREMCYLSPLILRVLEEMRHQLDEAGLKLHTDVQSELPPVLGDQRQLLQMIANLVENAVKFTPQGGEISVRAYEEDGGVLFRVQDTGVGIPPELQARVFERFFRAQQPGVEHVSGSGLGLSLVRSIISVHQGRIWLESESGRGTEVFVWLPKCPDQNDIE